MALSIKKISELSGVSIATVSRVINNKGNVSSRTAAKVQRVIDANGYIPNNAARALRNNQYPVIGMVVPDITNEFFARIVQSVQKRLFENHYSIIIYNSDERGSIESRCSEMMCAQSVKGAILISECPPSVCSIEKGLPTVYIDRHPNPLLDSFVSIESDNTLGSQLAARELIARGCKHIAIMVDSRFVYPHKTRLEVFAHELELNGLELEERMILRPKDMSFQEARRITTEIIEADIEIDGLFCMSDVMAMGAVTAAQTHNMKIPKDIRIIGYDDTSISQFGSKPITTIRQPLEEMGRLAVDTLISILNNKTIPQRHYTLPVELIRRTTT